MTDLCEELANNMLRAAEDQVAKANQILDQTKAMVEIMRSQVAAQLKANEDMDARFKQASGIMLDVHRILNGEKALGTLPVAPRLDHAADTAVYAAPLVRAGMRSIAAGVRADPAVVQQGSIHDPGHSGGDGRDPDDPARLADLRRTMEARQRFAAGHGSIRPRSDSGDPDPAF